MRIALIFNKEREDTTGGYFEKALGRTKHEVRHFWTKDGDSIPRDFDLYLRIDHGDYKYDLPTDLHPKVFLAIDTHLKKPYKKIKRQVIHYDLVFCAQKEGAERLTRDTKVQALWLPLGCDPQVHKKLEIARNLDIGFVGSDGKKSLRKMLLEKLRIKYPNSFLGMADFRKMSEIYSSCKIGFNYSLRNDINMRFFEVLSCGALLLTNHIKDNGFDKIFKDRENLVIYRNPKELFNLIDYYLAHKQEREKIARAGFQLALERCTYWHRLQTMFNYIAYRWGGKFNELRI